MRPTLNTLIFTLDSVYMWAKISGDLFRNPLVPCRSLPPHGHNSGGWATRGPVERVGVHCVETDHLVCVQAGLSWSNKRQKTC